MLMETISFSVLFLVFLALVFDFTNGFHDAGNSIATIVSTGVLTPIQAVFWAAFFNFIAFMLFKLSVATTIATGLIQPNLATPYLIFAALASAIIWNLITWYYGLPSSSSHALIGGLAGAAFFKGGLGALELSGFLKVFFAIIFSPLIGMIIGFALTFMTNRIVKKHNKLIPAKTFRYLQLISSAFLSLTHGGNDAQKTMGIIAILLYSSALLGTKFYIPFWVVISCHLVIALGTLAGGWRIVNTMGKKITHLNNLRGCCAETSAALVLFGAIEYGVPVSTTLTVTGAIAGVGLTRSIWGVRWLMMRTLFLTWIVTIPATACISVGIMFLGV